MCLRRVGSLQPVHRSTDVRGFTWKGSQIFKRKKGVCYAECIETVMMGNGNIESEDAESDSD